MKSANPSRSSSAKRFVLLGRGERFAPPGGAFAAGRVSLVGAGPGDPELLTIKAARRIAEADAVVHDGLVSNAILDLARPTARRISVAKRKAHHTIVQADIHALLIALAREGLDVVRLKGGDPFVFGRGGEELEACRAAGVACDVVPGITAAIAAAAAAGAPLTHRALARTLTLVSGHAAGDEQSALDWSALAASHQTLAVYMGLGAAGDLARRLMACGRDAATPALIVENASLPGERRILTSLAGLGEAAARLDGPAVLILGEAAALARESGESAASPWPLARAS